MGILIVVMMALAGIISLLIARAAMGRYLYTWGGKLERASKKKKPKEPKDGEAGYEYYRMKKPAWTPPSTAHIVLWAVAYLFSGYAFWRLFHGTCGLDNVYTSISFMLLGLGLIMNVLWSYTWYSVRRPMFGILCAGVGMATAITLLVIYAKTASTGAITWTAFAVQLLYSIWLLVSIALQVHTWSLNNGSSGRFFVKKSRRADDTDNQSWTEDPHTGIFYATIESDSPLSHF